MEKTGWKTVAIIFIILFSIMVGFLILGINQVNIEETRNYECGVECDKYVNCVSSYYDSYYNQCVQVTYDDLQNILNNK